MHISHLIISLIIAWITVAMTFVQSDGILQTLTKLSPLEIFGLSATIYLTVEILKVFIL